MEALASIANFILGMSCGFVPYLLTATILEAFHLRANINKRLGLREDIVGSAYKSLTIVNHLYDSDRKLTDEEVEKSKRYTDDAMRSLRESTEYVDEMVEYAKNKYKIVTNLGPFPHLSLNIRGKIKVTFLTSIVVSFVVMISHDLSANGSLTNVYGIVYATYLFMYASTRLFTSVVLKNIISRAERIKEVIGEAEMLERHAP